MGRDKYIEDDAMRKFSIGEKVFSKDNTSLKMTILRCSGKHYYCSMDNKKGKREVLFFEEDLISEWQIPFI